MSTTRIGADISVKGFGMLFDPKTQRLDFPRAHIDGLAGEADGVKFTARDVDLDDLHTFLDRTHWRASGCGAGGVEIRTADDAFALRIDRLELTRGVRVSNTAEGGIEIFAPQASLYDVMLELPKLHEVDPAPATAALVKAVDAPLRQEQLHVLDSLNGEISVTVKVVLELPLLGTRRLDQKLAIPIKDGAVDFRALERSLSWLEGAFLDFGLKKDRLALTWRVPVIGRKNEIVSFALDEAAKTAAVFDKVPLRCLADFRVPDAGKPESAKPGKNPLKALTLGDIKVDLSMAAPRSLEIANGDILFGGDDEPGIVGLQVAGNLVHPPGPGGLTGKAALLDVTAKDLALGPTTLTVDRLHLGSIDQIEMRFDGFTPTGLTAHIHRVTATNLSLRLS
jgi:hypothetical protein